MPHILVPALTAGTGSGEKNKLFEEADKYYNKEGNPIRSQGSQSVSINGGEGDDTITVTANRVRPPMDTHGNITESVVQGGDGNDTLTLHTNVVELLRGTKYNPSQLVNGGDGNNTVDVNVGRVQFLGHGDLDLTDKQRGPTAQIMEMYAKAQNTNG